MVRDWKNMLYFRDQRREDGMWADNFEGFEERRRSKPSSGLGESSEAGKAIT